MDFLCHPVDGKRPGEEPQRKNSPISFPGSEEKGKERERGNEAKDSFSFYVVERGSSSYT